jgi:hypothetical protein
MKIKVRYILLAAFAALSAYVYWKYDWRWNPWAAPRLVWEEPDPTLIGQTFSITVPAAYRCAYELPTPVKEMGVECDIDFDPKPIPIPSAEDIAKANQESRYDSKTKTFSAPAVSSTSGQYIQPTLISKNEVFTVERTYWIRINYLAQIGPGDKRFLIMKSSNLKLYSMRVSDFISTSKPDLYARYYDQAYISASAIANGQIAYENK